MSDSKKVIALLKSQKMRLNSYDRKSQIQFRKAESKSFKQEANKSQKNSNITYFNFFKNKNKQKSQSIEEKANKQGKHKQKTESYKIKHQNQKNQNKMESRNTKQTNMIQKYPNTIKEDSELQIGSQYGDYNYDYDLKEFMSKKRNIETQMTNISTKKTPFVSICEKMYNQRKQARFKTQLCSKNYSPAKKSLNSLKLIQKAYDQTQISRKSKTQIKFYLNLYKNQDQIDYQQKIQPIQLDKQPFKKQIIQIQKYQNSYQTPQLQSNKLNKPIPLKQTHHMRSKTQQQLVLPQKQRIFQKYENIKGYPKKFANTQRSNNKKANARQNTQCLQEQYTEQNNTNEKYNCFNFQKKYQIVPIFQNFNEMRNSKSGICFTPKANIRQNIQQKKLRRLIKTRQKDFFNNKKVYTHGIQSTCFTFEQIKQKLQKMQYFKAIRKINKSFTSLNGVNNTKSSLVNSNNNVIQHSNVKLSIINGFENKKTQEKFVYNFIDEDINVDNSKLKIQNYFKRKEQDIIIKYNGIKFKAKLIKKSENLYSKLCNKLPFQENNNKKKHNSIQNVPIKTHFNEKSPLNKIKRSELEGHLKKQMPPKFGKFNS